jgi:multiple sugar transport system permease protein
MYKETFVVNEYGQGSAVAMLLSVVTFAASAIYLRYQLADVRSA